MSETLRDLRERRKRRAERIFEKQMSDYEVNRIKPKGEAVGIYRPEKTDFATERNQRIEHRKSNRITVMCKSCGARLVKQPRWIDNRLRLFKMGKDVSQLLDFNSFDPQSEMMRMFPNCGNCLGTHWKKVRYEDRKVQRTMASILIQGDAFKPLKLGKSYKFSEILRSEKNI